MPWLCHGRHSIWSAAGLTGNRRRPHQAVEGVMDFFRIAASPSRSLVLRFLYHSTPAGSRWVYEKYKKAPRPDPEQACTVGVMRLNIILFINKTNGLHLKPKPFFVFCYRFATKILKTCFFSFPALSATPKMALVMRAVFILKTPPFLAEKFTRRRPERLQVKRSPAGRVFIFYI